MAPGEHQLGQGSGAHASSSLIFLGSYILDFSNLISNVNRYPNSRHSNNARGGGGEGVQPMSWAKCALAKLISQGLTENVRCACWERLGPSALKIIRSHDPTLNQVHISTVGNSQRTRATVLDQALLVLIEYNPCHFVFRSSRMTWAVGRIGLFFIPHKVLAWPRVMIRWMSGNSE